MDNREILEQLIQWLVKDADIADAARQELFTVAGEDFQSLLRVNKKDERQRAMAVALSKVIETAIREGHEVYPD